jgi:hypothetical protein
MKSRKVSFEIQVILSSSAAFRAVFELPFTQCHRKGLNLFKTYGKAL